jgi:hypothetical protein
MPRRILPPDWRSRLADLAWLSRLLGPERLKAMTWTTAPDTPAGHRWRKVALQMLREWRRRP